MKRITKLLLVFMIVLLLYGCKEEKEIIPVEHMQLNETIGSKLDFNNMINEYNKNNDYNLVLTSIDVEKAYLESYSLYEEKNVNKNNYSDYTPIASFDIYFERNASSAKIIDLLYTFPLSYDENEDNLKAEYNLYNSLFSAILSNSSKDTIEEVNGFFKMNSYEDFIKIYNGELIYDYRIIDIGDNYEDYISTLFLSDSKRISFEYHDSSFIDEK